MTFCTRKELNSITKPQQGSFRPQSKPKSFCKSFIVVNTVTNILALVQECSSNSQNITEKSQQINKHCCCFTEMVFFLYVVLSLHTLRVDISVTFKMGALINTCYPTLLPAASFLFPWLASLCHASLQSLTDQEGKTHTLYTQIILCSNCMNINLHNQFPTFHSP